MGFANSLNSDRRKTVPDGVNLADIPYIHVKDLIPKKGGKFSPVEIVGFFINKGKYGLGVTLLGNVDDELTGLNVPSWYVERFKNASDEDVEQILSGKLYITGVEEKETPNGTTYQIKFEDR